jgi:hypothetical protein
MCNGLYLEHGNVVLLPVKDGMFLSLFEDFFVLC